MAGRILVGVDGSPGSRRALAWALEEAAARGSVLEAVLVWRGPYDFPKDFYFPSDEEKPIAHARARLAEIVREVAAEHPEVEIESRVLEGDPAATLCRRAAQADALVVGSRGHGAIGALLLGSVSATCARHSPCPVVIVPAGRAAHAPVPQTRV